MKMKTVTLLVALGSLVACGQKSETTVPIAASDAATQADPAAPASPASKMVKGAGVVTAVDAKAGTITLDHEAIPEAGWPAMTMSFSAPAEVIVKAKPGEKVAFDLRIEDTGGTVTGIEKQ